MKKYFCNPVNVNYHYQFNEDVMKGGLIEIDREAADPSMIYFKGRYYIFASMTLGVWVSDDLVTWKNHRLPDTMRISVHHSFERRVGIWQAASMTRANCSATSAMATGP